MSNVPEHAKGVTYYLPADWMGEDRPYARAMLDFLEHDPATGEYSLRPPTGDEDRANEEFKIKLEPGEAISWGEFRIYGAFTLTVREDGTWICHDVPEDATDFSLDLSSDDLYSNLADLVSTGNLDDMGKPLAKGDHEVEAWHWGDDKSFVFDVIDGQPTFTEKSYE